MLRLARVLRLFKLGKSNPRLDLVVETLQRSAPSFAVLGFQFVVLVILFGSAIFYAEQGDYDRESMVYLRCVPSFQKIYDEKRL